MPSTYAHRLFGEAMLDLYPAEIAAAARARRELFDIGLHGPDILFYYKVLKADPVNAVGYRQHGLPGRAFFGPAKQTLEDAADADGAHAYLLGFLCHFALDSACHGYIENKIAVSGVTHTEIESEFDRFLLERQGIEPLHARLVGHIHPTKENAAVIAPFFEGVNARQVYRALRSMLFYNGLLRAPHQPKRGLVNLVLRLSGNYTEMHGMMIAKKPIPACADSNLRLWKLFARARQDCLSLTAEFEGYLRGENGLGEQFTRTFGPPQNWREIPVLSLQEEERYEI